MKISSRLVLGVVLISAVITLAAKQIAYSKTRGPDPLVGTWTLVSRQEMTAEGTIRVDPSLGETPLGLLYYDAAGHMAVQLMRRDRSADASLMTSMPMPGSPRLMMTVMGPLIGVVSGLVLGLFAFIASKLVKPRMKPSVSET
jgi:hypothetical protein